MRVMSKAVFLGTDPYDMLGRPISLNDVVVRATSTDSKDVKALELIRVTKIADGKIYCNDGKNPIKFPGRLLIVTQAVPADLDTFMEG
jgi:hypothetical protein